MLPKKGRREILVDEVLYHYKVSGSISLVVRNSVTGEIIKWFEDRKPKWGIEFRPSDVAEIIRTHNIKYGVLAEGLGGALQKPLHWFESSRRFKLINMKLNTNEVKKDLYKSKNMAKFSHYIKGNLYYVVELTSGTYQFPISTVENIIRTVHDGFVEINTIKLSEDLGETSFGVEVKGSELIRWISKAIDNDEFIKIGEVVSDVLLIPDYIRNNSDKHFNGRTHYNNWLEKTVWEEED